MMNAVRSRRFAAGHASVPCGFSLIEVLITIVILGVGIAALTGMFALATRSSVDPILRKQALAIAEGMLQEISLKDFANPGGGYVGSDRARFDDVRDYHGYASTGIVSIDGVAIAGLEPFSLSVAVEDVALGSGATQVPAGQAVRITVNVTHASGAIALSAYRTAFAAGT